MKRLIVFALMATLLLSLPAAAKYGVKKTIPLGGTGTYPNSLAFNPLRSKLYCSNTGSGSISVIDALQDSLLANIPVIQPGEMVYAQGSDRLFVHDLDFNLWAISGSGDSIVASTSFGQGWCELAYNQLQDKIYVSNGTDGLAFYTSSNLAYLGYNTAVNGNLFFAEPLNKLYGVGGAQVFVLDGASNAVIDSFAAMGIESNSLFAYNPAVQKLYVTTAQGDLCVVNALNDDVIAMLPLGASAAGMAHCPLNNAVYVARVDGAMVEVFPDETYNVYSTGGIQLSGIVYNPADSLVYTVDHNIYKGINNLMLFDPQTQAFRDSVQMTGTNMYTNLVADNQGDVYTADYMLDQAYAVGRVPNTAWRSNPMSGGYGQWMSGMDWEIYDTLTGSWIQNPQSTVYPSAADSSVLIQAGDTMAVDGDITVDELTIDGVLQHTGGQITVSNGLGVDILVNGTFSQGTGTFFTQLPGSQWVYGPSSKHEFMGGDVDPLPLAAWDSTSLLHVLTVGFATSFALGSAGQQFGDILWSAPTMGIFTLASEPVFGCRDLQIDTGSVEICSGVNPKVTVRNYTQNRGDVRVRTVPGAELEVAGDFQLNGDVFLMGGAGGGDTLRLRGSLYHNGGYMYGYLVGNSANVIFNGSAVQSYTFNELMAHTAERIEYRVMPGSLLYVGGSLGAGNPGTFTLSPGAVLGAADPQGFWLTADSGAIRCTGGRSYGPNAGFFFGEGPGPGVSGDAVAGNVSMIYAGSSFGTTLMASVTLSDSLLLQGPLVTGSDTIFLGAGAITSMLGGRVEGNLAKYFQPGSEYKDFEVGTAGGQYSPVGLQLYNSTQPGYVTVSALAGPHPMVDSIDQCLLRHWRISAPGMGFDNSEVTLNYLPGDFNSAFFEALHESTMAAGRYGNGAVPGWTLPAVINRTCNGPADGGSITLVGGSSFDDSPEFTTGRDQASIHWSALADTTGPSIMATIPPEGATGVALNTAVMVSFTEPINTSLFAYSVMPALGGLSVSWTPDSMLATISHDDFLPVTSYTVTVTSAPDTAGNPLDTAVVPNHWSFTTGAAPDTLPPAPPESLQIYGFNPSYWFNSLSSSVPVGWINPLDSTGIQRAFYKTYEPPTNNLDFTDSIMAVGGARDTFWLPVDTLNGMMPVYVWLRDGAGNASYLNSGLVTARRDTVPPAGAAVKPFSSDTVHSTSFTVNWGPGFDGLSGIQAWRVLFRVDTSAAWDTLAPFHNDTTMIFSGALAGHRYYFEASAIDSAYNMEVLIGSSEATIYVAQPDSDTTPPSILYTTPTDGASGVGPADSVTITFSEPILSSGFAYTFSPDPGGLGTAWNADSTRVRIDHPLLASATRYVIRVTAAVDTMGLALAGVDSFSFTTAAAGDTVRPFVVSNFPSSGATGVILTAPVVVNFSEPLDPASFRFACSPTVGGWSVVWSDTNRTATLTHDDFGYGTLYTFQVDSAADTSGNHLDTTAASRRWTFTSATLTTATTPWSGGAWRLFSVPMMPQDTSAMAILGDDLGAYSDTTWRLVGYKPNYGNIERPSLWPGYGYWLASAQGATIDVQGALLSGMHTVALDSGWNMVGNPFDTSLALSGFRVRWNDGAPHELYYSDSLVNPVLRQVMWQYLDSTGDLVNNGTWDSLEPGPASDTIRPWGGYAVYAARPCSLVMEKFFKGKPSPGRPPRQMLWAMELSASMGPWADKGLRIGISPQASSSYDRLDAEKPPLVSENLAIYLPHDDWGQGPCRRYLRDVRPPGAERRWLVKVDAGGNIPIEISYAVSGTMEPGYKLFLVDRRLGQGQLVTGQGRLTMARDGDLEAIYTARGLEELELRPLEFGLTKIHPNPFRGRTAISYQLDRPGRVSLKIYNSLGQLTATLVDGHREAGFHAAVWDGQRAAAGVYLVRLESEGRTMVTKTVKLR